MFLTLQKSQNLVILDHVRIRDFYSFPPFVKKATIYNSMFDQKHVDINKVGFVTFAF